MRFLCLLSCSLLFFGCGKPESPPPPLQPSEGPPAAPPTPIPAKSAPMPERPWLQGKVEHGISLYGPQDLRKGPNEPYRHANPRAPKGGTLRVAELGAFEKLNPLSLKGNPAPGLGLLFETLVDDSEDPDEFFAQYANIAERIVLAEDRLSITYHLNKAARFSDGEALDADDVVFSFNLVQDPEYIPMYKSYFADVKACEKIDSHSVRFVFAKYNQELPLIIGQLLILPQHVYGAEGKVFGKDFDEIAVGSGPYVVDSFDLGKHITYKRDPNWWGKDLPINQGRYNFDTIRYIIFLDPVPMREAIKGDEVDIAEVVSAKNWATEFDGDFVQKNYIVKRTFPHGRVAGMQGFAYNLRKPIFQDIKVRKAIAAAFDFDHYSENLFYGQYTRHICYFDNHEEMMSRGPAEGKVKERLIELRQKHNDSDTGTVHIYKDAITVGPYNIGEIPGRPKVPMAERIAAANKVLDDLGWVFDKDSGVRSKDGQQLAFDILIHSPVWQTHVGIFAENLAKLGIKCGHKLVQPAEYIKRLETFDFEMIIQSFRQSASPGNEQRDFWTGEAADIQGSRNVIGIRNPAVDEVVEALIEARSRADLVTEVQVLDRILSSNHYLIPQWYISYDRALYWNRVRGPKRYAGKVRFESNVLEWWWYDAQADAALKAARAAKSTLSKPIP